MGLFDILSGRDRAPLVDEDWQSLTPRVIEYVDFMVSNAGQALVASTVELSLETADRQLIKDSLEQQIQQFDADIRDLQERLRVITGHKQRYAEYLDQF